MYFNRTAKAKLKGMNLNIFHGLAPGYVAEQNRISNHDSVKFVIYEGAGRRFSVCLKAGDFINYVKNYNDFINKLGD